MTEVKVKKSIWRRRILWSAIAAFLCLVIGVVALRIFITTAPGARFIENQINQRSFGAIEGVNISGLTGDPLNNISIKNIEIRDKDGVWLRAQNFNLTWKPFAFFKDHIWVQNLTTEKIDIRRTPNLNSAKREGDPLKITFESFQLAAVSMDTSLLGQALEVESSGQFIALPSGAITAKLSAARLDAAGDNLTLDFTRSKIGEMKGVFDIQGIAGGAIAAFLKAPKGAIISGRGDLSGTIKAGDGKMTVLFGETETIRASTLWTDAAIDADAIINVSNWPALDVARQRLGSTFNSTLHIDRTASPQIFSAAIKAPGLSIDAKGLLPEKGLRPNTVDINLIADKVSTLIPLPEGYNAGRLEAKGRAELQAPYGYKGHISLGNLQSPYGSATQITGPITVSQYAVNNYAFTTDFALTNAVPKPAIPVELAAKTRIQTTGQLNQSTQRITVKSIDLTSGINHIIGKGTLTTDGKNLDLSGKATANIKPQLRDRASTQSNIPEGMLEANFALAKTAQSLLAITTDGTFRPSANVPAPFDKLIGGQLIFNAKMNPMDQGLNISEISIIGENAKAAIEGVFGDQLNLSGEMLLSTEVNYNSMLIERGAEGRFVITGTRAAPTLRLDAKAEAITLQNYGLSNARLRAEITDLLEAPKGPVQLEAETKQGPLTATTQFASSPDAYIANEIEINWGRLAASGQLQYPQSGIATGQISLRLPEREGQYAKAAVTLTNMSGEQGVNLAIEGKQIAFAGFQIDRLTGQANGTLASLSGALKVDGHHGNTLTARQFDMETPFTLTRTQERAYDLSTDPNARYGDIRLSARSPIIAAYSSGQLSVNAPLLVSGGNITIEYQKNTGEEKLRLDAKALPVTLLPLPYNLADTRGQMSAEINLFSSAGEAVQGGGTVTLTDWRGFDIDKGKGLTAEMRADINGGETVANMTASSPAGFNAKGQIQLALKTSSALIGQRINMDAPISGDFSASGAAASVFGLFTPSDAELGGTVSANISIEGTASNPRVEGQAGGQDIRFEVPELGTQIRKGRATANFTNDSLSIRDLYVADSEDGTLTGIGDFKLGELGRPIGKMDIKANSFRVLDRKDVRAKVKGDLKFVSAAKDATLSGDMTIERTELKQFVSSHIGVIEIDVEEINRPNQEDKITIKRPPTPINLDVNVRAPRRVFIRSRGLDVEMSVDTRIKGTLTEPLFYGDANVIRGGYKLAGKTLDFESGTIKFDGELSKAMVDFKAVTETQNLGASVTIKGTVEAPEIELSSTPERPQDEILSALLFGRSATELSAIEAAQLAGALAQFSSKGGGFDLLGGLRDTFGIGQLSVNFNADGSAQLVGGRYLAKNVYLQIFSGAGPDQTGAIIDWEIRKNIALRSRIRADNDQALSLKWKRDF